MEQSGDLTARFRSAFLRMSSSKHHANLAIYGGEADISSANFINAGKFGRRQIAVGAKFIF